MAESQPLRIVMAPKTKRAVALGLAAEAYSDYTAAYDNGKDDGTGRWADNPEHHAANVVKVAEQFLSFLEDGAGE